MIGAPVPEVHGPARAGDQRTSALDSSLIAERLGWRPRVELEDGLEETVAWFRERAERDGAPT
jgi:UDP-glucose 4-epimerase